VESVDRERSAAKTALMLSFLDRLLGRPEAPGAPSEAHRLAVAALLVEVARSDGHFSIEERQRIEAVLAERLGLAADDVATLMAEAERAADSASDWHGFTRELNRVYGQEERIAVLEMLWDVVDADGRVHSLEASLMRRLPALLYVSDRANAEARRRARERRGG
jgi:uncharacterized tellurite resistance protein B-like protein